MFRKLSLFLMFAAALPCFGQMTTSYGSGSGPDGTGIAVYPADAPLVSTPDVALPGSGPAVGAPLSSSNDSRLSTGPSVANPNLALLPGAVSSQVSLATNGANPNTSNEGFEFGIQTFISGSVAGNGSQLSLAEIVTRNKAQRRKAPKSFNNDSIAQLNAAGVRTGNLEPSNPSDASSEVASNPQSNTSFGTETLIAENRAPALPQSDQLDEVQPARRSSATAAQQRHPVATQSAPAPQTQASAAEVQNPSSNQSANTSAQLPQTSSSLPLILLVGALGIAGAALYLLRR